MDLEYPRVGGRIGPDSSHLISSLLTRYRNKETRTNGEIKLMNKLKVKLRLKLKLRLIIEPEPVGSISNDRLSYGGM